FATDFAEKYKVKPITLTEDAKTVLLKYRFPGNIRQLKNLVEQISVLSPDNKEINGATLAQYLPSASTLPAVIGAKTGPDISEREILYKVLFDLKKDVNEVKKMVLEVLSDPAQAQQILKNNTHLFEGIQETKIKSEPVVLNINPGQNQPAAEEEVQDISHEAEDDSLSIQKKEKELIVRALSKNRNKRKYAARDLGISERTLYRKIKEYDLEK
ncbi:MAG TPA: helix-turn-helix domain-containing protein, partial [Cyclobacteriaceae bacterium]|nr:helix-turn-helix domain-containing protein [Cyclobacteriaceae bacterium]